MTDSKTEEQEPVDATTELDALHKRIERADAERIRLEAEVKRQRMLVAGARIDGMIKTGQVKREARQALLQACLAAEDEGEALLNIYESAVIVPTKDESERRPFGNHPVLQQ